MKYEITVPDIVKGLKEVIKECETELEEQKRLCEWHQCIELAARIDVCEYVLNIIAECEVKS